MMIILDNISILLHIPIVGISAHMLHWIQF